MWSVRGDSARTVLVHLCELPSRPKVSLRALILRSNNSAARLSPRLREKIYTPLRESTCITARVLFVLVRKRIRLPPTVNLSQGREKKLKFCMKTGGLQKDFVILQMF